jgi:DTW domain-containing protein YfiP|tara:strand:+ start:447 stop:632 length:186 start_codon:yes stop_codon:yes gene_type:complete
VEIEKEKRENEKQKIFKGSPVKYCLKCGRKKWSCRCYRVSGFEELRNVKKRRMLSQGKSKV